MYVSNERAMERTLPEKIHAAAATENAQRDTERIGVPRQQQQTLCDLACRRRILTMGA